MLTERRNDRRNMSVEKNLQTFKSDDCAYVRNDDDCSVIFDSRQTSSELHVSPHCRKGTNNATDSSKETSQKECHDECHIVFDSYLQNGGTSLYPVDDDDLFRSVAEKSCDRQTLQVIESRDESILESNLDMEEVSLDFEPSLLHALHGTTDSVPIEKRNELLSQGIAIQSGKWSKREDGILLRNWDNFVQKYKVDNPVLLLGLYRGRNNVFRNFCHSKKFLLQLGKDLNDRLIRSVYCRARKLLDVWNYKGRFSEREKRKLLKLHSKFGNNWSKIAVLMNRTSLTCCSTVRILLGTSRYGSWTDEEDKLLLRSVKRHVGTEMFTKFCGYPWVKIAKDVPGRNAIQCQQHWLHCLCWKPRLFNQPKWKMSDSALLIYLMYSDMVEEECFIDWHMLYEKFRTSAVSYASLQYHWRVLKSKVPNYHEKDHESIVIYLYKIHLSKILSKLKLSISDLEHRKNMKSCNYLEATVY